MKRSSDDIIEEIRKAKSHLEDEKGGYHHLIKLYTELRQQLRKENDRDAAGDVEDKLIYYLVEYGSYMKMVHEKKDNEAMDALKKALHYDRALPLAYYRLGFLFYRQRRFAEAGNHFSKALEHQERAKRFRMNKRQLYYAHLYLINSELHVVHATQQQMEKLELEGKYEPLESAELSNLYERMTTTDKYLENHAFIKRTNEGETFISKEGFDEMVGEEQPGVVYLYFGDRNIEVYYDDGNREFSKDDGEVLLYLLLHSNERPLDGKVLGQLRGEWEEVKSSTLRQRVSRLNRRLAERGIDFQISHVNGGYAIEEEKDYVIIHRADEAFEALRIPS
ncbi:hypothetical protein [Salimicrobium halophilum]|uniref:Uncharacterized protein n=1 Tax=Salimicrobium halophilum TaxID=86666 RepID=A0A1G8T8F7_9BACI|nr:hypothetical protein [Salimicrobium halophilum]SDJ37832.1 hypothetical protein SAMN04490247_1766 [Salimicrobium halophilum]